MTDDDYAYIGGRNMTLPFGYVNWPNGLRPRYNQIQPASTTGTSTYLTFGKEEDGLYLVIIARRRGGAINRRKTKRQIAHNCRCYLVLRLFLIIHRTRVGRPHAASPIDGEITNKKMNAPREEYDCRSSMPGDRRTAAVGCAVTRWDSLDSRVVTAKE